MWHPEALGTDTNDSLPVSIPRLTVSCPLGLSLSVRVPCSGPLESVSLRHNDAVSAEQSRPRTDENRARGPVKDRGDPLTYPESHHRGDSSLGGNTTDLTGNPHAGSWTATHRQDVLEKSNVTSRPVGSGTRGQDLWGLTKGRRSGSESDRSVVTLTSRREGRSPKMEET